MYYNFYKGTMPFPCPGQESELAIGREKQVSHDEDNYEGFMHGNITLTTIQSLWHPSMIYRALMNAGWGAKRARIHPTRRDSHGGRSDGMFITRLHRVAALRDRFDCM